VVNISKNNNNNGMVNHIIQLLVVSIAYKCTFKENDTICGEKEYYWTNWTLCALWFI